MPDQPDTSWHPNITAEQIEQARMRATIEQRAMAITHAGTNHPWRGRDCDALGEIRIEPTPDARVFRCSGCDSLFWGEPYNVLHSRCEPCSECADCHGSIESGALEYTTEDGALVCSTCWSANDWVRVSRNESLHRRADCVWVNGIGWETEGYADRHYFYRDGEYYESDPDASYDDEYEDSPEPESSPYPLRYGANVLEYCSFDKSAVQSGALLFGVELEMESVNESVTDLTRALGGNITDSYILKTDGSLIDGVELVTVPLTLEQHRNEFDWQRTLAPVLSIARSGHNTSRCGIHVHINRKALTPLQIGKMLVFTNSVKMFDLVTCIAQRNPSGYCQRKPKVVSDGGKRGEDRYEMINVSGSRTVEVRMFRGNLRWERVLKNLEFCHALVTYCKDASIQEIESPAAFCKWLGERRKDYPHLTEFLVQWKYLPARINGAVAAERAAAAAAIRDV